jgi:mannose-6-phosphate isomerase-like protein (cupin superfamily)
MMRRGTLKLFLMAAGVLTFTTVRSTVDAQAPAAGAFSAPTWAAAIPLNPSQPEKPTHWSADSFARVHAELTARALRSQPLNARDLLPLPMTRTHGYTVGYRTGKEAPSAEQHAGVTDVYFVMGGSATMVTGGELTGRQQLTEGEYRGTAVQGGVTHRLKAGDVLLVPPNAPHAAQADPGGFSYLLLKINVGLYPWPIVAGGFGTGGVGVPLSPNQPEQAIYWSVDDFRKQHQASAARAAAAASGAAPGPPVNLIPRMTYRTHGWVAVYRPVTIMTTPLPAEMHTGVTDVYIVLGGSAKMIVGGTLDNKHVFCEPRANLPGGARCLNLPLEYQGDCSAGCQGGVTLQLKPGDVLNMPPDTEHWVTEPEPNGPNAGFTYMLFKINAGLYPWQLVDFDF